MNKLQPLKPGMASKKLIVMIVAILLFGTNVLAQSQTVDMADVMRSNGKIYIVVAVCLTILTGLFLYLVSLDKKISKIEKETVS